MKTFHINSRAYTKEELMTHCQQVILENTSLPWEKDLGSFILEWLGEEDSIRVNTSGSTGKPREMKLPKNGIKLSAKKTIDFFQLKERQHALLCLPVQYIAGKMMVVRALEAGLNLIAIKPEVSPKIQEIDRVDFAAMSPLQVRSMASQGSLGNKIKKLIIGGGAVEKELNALVVNSGIEAYETYGMTETMSHVALRKIEKNFPTPFKALPGISFKIDNRRCLSIKTDFLEQTIQTNDLVKLISDTSFHYIGRQDFIINSGGVKLNPEEVEASLKELTGINVILSKVPDKELGEKAILVLSSHTSKSQLQDIENRIKSDNNYHFIKNYVFIENVPQTKNGKLDRGALSRLVTDFGL